LLYLPPYSPDYNPIEEAFSKFKAFIRHNIDLFSVANGPATMYHLYEAALIITAEDAQGYFSHAGYL
ncbi:uncharacterized protein SCHCODRAFT_02496386, partial [Schizophyllum commune H4-8]|uniref:uncharacterized protein n=1 Tax=Schizophyllum commune (strain H4-8 / FGSC 9210) TaxID=578458 RepID=UPI00215EE37C